jgi:hypothetical protein
VTGAVLRALAGWLLLGAALAGSFAAVMAHGPPRPAPPERVCSARGGYPVRGCGP